MEALLIPVVILFIVGAYYQGINDGRAEVHEEQLLDDLLKGKRPEV